MCWSSFLIKLHNCSLQHTTWPKIPWLFGSVQKEKDVLKVPQFQKKLFATPEFLALARKGFKKNVSCESSEIVGNLPGKCL